MYVFGIEDKKNGNTNEYEGLWARIFKNALTCCVYLVPFGIQILSGELFHSVRNFY